MKNWYYFTEQQKREIKQYILNRLQENIKYTDVDHGDTTKVFLSMNNTFFLNQMYLEAKTQIN